MSIALEIPCQHDDMCDYHGTSYAHGCVCIHLRTRSIVMPFDNADSAVEIMTELYRSGQISAREYDRAIDHISTCAFIAPCRVHRTSINETPQ